MNFHSPSIDYISVGDPINKNKVTVIQISKCNVIKWETAYHIFMENNVMIRKFWLAEISFRISSDKLDHGCRANVIVLRSKVFRTLNLLTKRFHKHVYQKTHLAKKNYLSGSVPCNVPNIIPYNRRCGTLINRKCVFVKSFISGVYCDLTKISILFSKICFVLERKLNEVCYGRLS